MLEIPPISGIADILSASDRERVARLVESSRDQVPDKEKLKAQLKEMLEIQKKIGSPRSQRKR